MSHGFSRFGQAPARERLHRQMRGPGTISMLLPTIAATLFMFTVVITLNKASSLTRGGKIVRLMNVDDVFPTRESVEQNRKKEFWELTVPPPSPDAVLEGEPAVPQLVETVIHSISDTFHDGDRSSELRPEIPLPSRPLPAIKTDLQPPTVAPDTSLPVATPTP
jgi:hypothetical protein